MITLTPQQLEQLQTAANLLNTVLSQITSPIPGVSGCTDPAANNYNPAATQDDGSCTYDEQR